MWEVVTAIGTLALILLAILGLLAKRRSKGLESRKRETQEKKAKRALKNKVELCEEQRRVLGLLAESESPRWDDDYLRYYMKRNMELSRDKITQIIAKLKACGAIEWESSEEGRSYRAFYRITEKGRRMAADEKEVLPGRG